MTIWNVLSQKNFDKFAVSGKISYALKAIAAVARAPVRPQFKIRNVTVEDFISSLEEVVLSGGQIDDPLQKILNKNIAAFLINHLQKVKPELPVLREVLPKNHLKGLIQEVLPFDKDSLDALRRHLDGQEYPTPEIESTVKEISSQKDSLVNALSFTLGMAFISVIKQQILNNPILTVLPDNLIKTASEKEPFKARGPRLNDLIDALRIAHGKSLIEYNQAAVGDFLQGSSNFEALFPTGLAPGHQKQLANTPAQLAVLSAAYIRHYKELQRSLQEYCWSNIMDVNTRTISKSGEVLTPNIYINPNMTDIGNVKNITSLLSKEQKLAPLDLNMKMWNGQPYRVASASLSMDDIRTKFLSGRNYSEVAAEVIDESMESIERARTYMRPQAAAQTAQVLVKLMNKPNANLAADIFDEFMAISKENVGKAVESDSGQFLAAAEEAKRTYGNISSESELAGTDFKTKDLDNIVVFNEEILFALESSIAAVINKHGSHFKDQSSLKIILSNLFKTYAMPLLPISMRYVYNAPSAIKLIQSSSSSEKEAQKINDRIGTIADGIIPSVATVLSSQMFEDRYVANEEEYKSSVTQTDKLSRLRDESLGSAVVPSKLEPIAQMLGIDDASLKARQRDIALAYSGSGSEGLRRKRDAINKTISDIMGKYDELRSQGVIDDVSREHVLVYICNKVLPGILEEYVTDAIVKNKGIKTQEQQEELSNYIRTNFMSLKGGKTGALLASNTVYGKLSELYRAIDEKKASGADTSKLEKNPLAAIIVGADYGYRSKRAAPALSVITNFFKQNQDDPGVTDGNWADPSNPRPRSWQELAHLTKAFADPIPDKSSKITGIVRKTRINIQPGERKSRKDIDLQNEERIANKKGKIVESTVQSNLYNTVRRLGNNIAGNPVGAIREAMMQRRREILSISPAYENDIKPYTIGGDVPFDKSPYVADEYVAPEVAVDFTSTKIDEEKVNSVIDESDENPDIKEILSELQQKGASPDVLEKVKAELRKLPASYLSGANRATTVETIMAKIAPGAKFVLRRPVPSKPPTTTPQQGSSVIESLSKTIFYGNKLADRLKPTAQDSAAKLNSKVEELMSHVQAIAMARTGMQVELRESGADQNKVARLRDLLNVAKIYNSQLLAAINYAKDLAEKMESESSDSEFDYIRESLPGSRQKIREFISRMSQLPAYKSRQETVKHVSQALDSLTNVKDMEEAVSPQALQLLLLELSRRSSAGDDFENLLLELDKFRVRNTRPPQDRMKREEVEDIESIFEEQTNRWDSAIRKDQQGSVDN